MRWELPAILVLVSSLGACIPRAETPAPVRGSTGAAAAAAPDDPSGLQCRTSLERASVDFQWLPDRRFDTGCSALGAVRLTGLGVEATNLGAMTCPLALRFSRWSREDVQGAAVAWLDSPVVRIETFGTFACRPVNGRTGARLSEHAFANAVDVAAFALADGRRITVRDGWNGPDPEVRRFLREIHQAGCRAFEIGLGPDADAFHHDHLHFDMGHGPYCR